MKHYIDSQNNVHAYQLDGSQDHLIPKDFIAVTDEELVKIRADNAAKAFNGLPYQDKRLMEYPQIGEQLDALFKAGVFPADMAQRIQAVKDKYPKA
jgi:hypothetical protein